MKIPRFLWRLWGKVVKLLDWLAIKVSCVARVDGIIICDLTPRDLAKSDFRQPTLDALDLIRKYDPRRYRRVVRYIKYVVNRPLISTGNFERTRRMCNVDYNKQFAKSSPWNLYRFACLLIHEATHGQLLAKGLAYNDKTWERTERLCHLEEYRFIHRIDQGWADLYRNPQKFNPELWPRRRRESRADRQAAWRKRGEEWRQERRKMKEEHEREKR